MDHRGRGQGRIELAPLEAIEAKLPEAMKRAIDGLPRANEGRGRRWTEQENAALVYGIRTGVKRRDLADYFGICDGTLIKRARELGVLPEMKRRGE